MDQATRDGIGAALGRIPGGLFILTARHEDRRMGMLASWVQQCCFSPPMVSIAVAKGRSIMPLISESRKFGLCQLSDQDRSILRKFASPSAAGEDPFLSFELVNTPSGVPLFATSMAYLECDLVCHMDVEGDHDLFVGAIKLGKHNGGEPHVHLRESGFKY